MATIVGFATGLALRNFPNRLNLLWLGIFIAFIVLFYQYIPGALAQQKILVSNHDYYLFHHKINTVMMGIILLAGIDGVLFDHLRSIGFRWSYFRLSCLLYWPIGSVMLLWLFVYIVNARNRIGLSTILYSFWFLFTFIILTKSQIQSPNQKNLVRFSICCIRIVDYSVLCSFTNKSQPRMGQPH
jgi:hypothetical protein